MLPLPFPHSQAFLNWKAHLLYFWKWNVLCEHNWSPIRDLINSSKQKRNRAVFSNASQWAATWSKNLWTSNLMFWNMQVHSRWSTACSTNLSYPGIETFSPQQLFLGTKRVKRGLTAFQRTFWYYSTSVLRLRRFVPCYSYFCNSLLSNRRWVW